MEEEALIDLRSFSLKGDVLDIGRDNNGIIYNYIKNSKDDIIVDLVELPEEIEALKTKTHDNGILFFFLSTLRSNREKKEFLKELASYIKEDGELLLWDIEKRVLKPYKKKIKILLKKEVSREITIIEADPLLASSLRNTEELIREDFELLESKSHNGIYHIRAKRKGRDNNNA